MSTRYNLVDEKCGEPNESELLKRLAPELGHEWQNIGLALGVTVASLKQFAVDPKLQGNQNLCLAEVITQWRNAMNPEYPYKWSTILEALAKDPLVASKSKRVAEEIYNELLPPEVCMLIACTEGTGSIEEDNDENGSDTSGTASEDTVTFLCGCDECTIDEFLHGQVGCKNPGKSARFPLLDTSKLSNKQQQIVISQLALDTEEIEDDFAVLTSEIGYSFIQRNVDLSKLKMYFSSLEYVKARVDNAADEHLFNPILEKIDKVESITGLFNLMANFWSWFNYRLLERVARSYGNENEKDRFAKYLKKLKTFLERYVYEMPSSIHNPKKLKGYTKLSCKLIDSVRNSKACDIQLIQHALGRVLGVDHFALVLTSIKEGCVELVFMVPESMEKYFPLSENSRSEIFRFEWKFCMITCGNAEPEIFRQQNECVRICESVNKKTHQTADDTRSIISESSSGIGSMVTTITKNSSELRSEHNSSSHDMLSIISESSGIESFVQTKKTSGSEQTSEIASKNTIKPHIPKYKGIYDICQECLSVAPENESLILNRCHNPDLHDGFYPLVCAAWDDETKSFIQIRPLPQMAIIRGFALCNGTWCRGDNCTFAHGLIEKQAWNYEINKIKREGKLRSLPKFPTLLERPGILHAHPSLNANGASSSINPTQIIRFTFNRRENYTEFNKWKTKFIDRLQRTKLKDEDLEPKLTADNYQEKFYSLLCFEEMEHINLLTEKCDKAYEFELVSSTEAQNFKCLPYENLQNVGVLKSMSGNQITYATQSSEGLFFVDFDQDGNSRDICKAHILSCNFSKIEKYLYISLNKRDVNKLQQHIAACRSNNICHVEFEVKHGFFDSLHKAVVNIPSFIIPKIMPTNGDEFPATNDVALAYQKHEAFQLAKGAQLSALNLVLSASHRAPVLISGPFGSGKTRILARATYELIKKSLHSRKQIRILICAHHSASLHTYINDYFKKLCESDLQSTKIIRITRGTFPKDTGPNSFFSNLSEFRESISQGQYLNEKCLVVVTTYMTSIQLLSIIKEDDWYFTHVFLDEAGQVREPEAIASLSLAGKDTKIVIAGDSKQVGPALLVLGEPAHENGLGISMLERLEKKYEEIGDRAVQYRAVLNDNYRCNQQITEFLSKLFYNGKARSKVSIPMNPKPKMILPFSFYCSDVEQYVRAPQESTFEAEADAVINQLNFYYDPHLRKGKLSNMDKISVITPNRDQVNMIRQKLRGSFKKVNVLPTFMIQGHEFESVFLSTSEPLELDGRSQDPQKSLCNPHVFNTAISRAKSQVVAIGNPFMLLKVEEVMGSRRKCWREYIKLCLKGNKIYFPSKYNWRLRSQILANIMQAIDTDDLSSLFVQEKGLSLEKEPEQEKIEFHVPPPIQQPISATLMPKIKSYAQVAAHNTTKKRTTKKPRFPSKSENINIASPTDSDDEESKPNDVILQKFMDSLLPK